MKTVKAAMVKATAAREARQLRERTAANVAAAEKFIAGGVADSFRDNGPESALATLPDALACPDLGLDELEPETRAAIEEAEAAESEATP